jgi:hypothetical protein
MLVLAVHDLLNTSLHVSAIYSVSTESVSKLYVTVCL